MHEHPIIKFKMFLFSLAGLYHSLIKKITNGNMKFEHLDRTELMQLIS